MVPLWRLYVAGCPAGLERVDLPRISLVIRCYNEAKHIGRLLVGIERQSFRDIEIILVDSGSTDATLDIAAHFPVRILHITPDRFSFGRSLNMGCAAATGDVIVIASAHVYPTHADWLERLLAPFDADPTVAIVYGGQRGDERTRYSEHRIFQSWFSDTPNPDQQHPFCNNANAAIRRTFWLERPYDEVLTGLEDLEWATHMRRQGRRIVYDPTACIIHVHEETPGRVLKRYQREAIALRAIMPELRFGFPDFLRLLTANIASDLWQALKEGKLPGVAWEILWFRFMQFWGTWRGHRLQGDVPQALMRAFFYPASTPPSAWNRDEARGNLRIDYGSAPIPGHQGGDKAGRPRDRKEPE